MSDKITFYAPGLVVWEAPLATLFSRGNTTNNTTTLLYGLPAIIGAVAYLRGIYDIRKAETKDVRNHFIGSNPRRAKAKPLVMRQCRAMGMIEPVAREPDCSPRGPNSVVFSGRQAWGKADANQNAPRAFCGRLRAVPHLRGTPRIKTSRVHGDTVSSFRI
jgi:hypothetical protein